MSDTRHNVVQAVNQIGPVVGVGGSTVSGSAPSLGLQGARYRMLTVVFCDLVDSTSLCVALSSKDLRDLLLTYYSHCSAVFERNGGLVLRYVGDGVLAVFGDPADHHGDAENAARSGLEIIKGLQKLRTDIGLIAPLEVAVRVTAATGRVFADESIGCGPAQQTAVFGQAPYLAARLKDVADPNTVVVAPQTHRLVADRFETEDLGCQQLKGFAEPVRAWRVTEPRANGVRLWKKTQWVGGCFRR